MKRTSSLTFLLLFLVLLAFSGSAFADTKVLTVPKGTVLEQVGPQQFRLKGPEGCVFEIKGFQRTGKGQVTFGEVGIIGDCGIYDKNGKLIATGAKGVLRSGPKPANSPEGGTPRPQPNPPDYIKVDTFTIWLPATIEFTPVRVFNRPALLAMCAPAERSGNT